MSGHSHWATIKRKKGAGDAKRGQVFTKLAKEITMAAREGGDPNMNFKLRLAVDKARESNMPKDSIERAIKRGTGESKDGAVFEDVMYEGYGPKGVALMVECVTENRNRTVADVRHALSRAGGNLGEAGSGAVFEDVMYEGYGPKGVAFMVECVTENRNRTVADVRHALSRAGGNLGEAGSVAWQFSRKAYFLLTGDNLDFDKIFEIALENGADDVEQSEDGIEIYAEADAYKMMSDALFAAGLHIQEAQIRMIPNQPIDLPLDDTLQVLRVIDALEELDDVQQVYHNMNISDEAIAALENEE